MAVANYFIFDARNAFFEGAFTVAPSRLASSTPVQETIKADIADLVTISAVDICIAAWRLYVRAVTIDEGVVPEFGGVPTRYKLGSYNAANADAIYPVTYLNYVKQISESYVCVFGTPDAPLDIPIVTPSLNSSTATILGVNTPASGLLYNYATDLFIDPAVGVELDALVSYQASYTGEVLNSGTDTLVLYNS